MKSKGLVNAKVHAVRRSTVEHAQFVDPHSNVNVPPGDEAEFLNNYFCNITDRLGIDTNVYPEQLQLIEMDLNGLYGHIDTTFDLTDDLITVDKLEHCTSTIDLTKGSSIPGIGTFICRDIMKFLTIQVTFLFNRSIESGIFPRSWSKGTVTVIPKNGNPSDPSNWRPITQTPIFAKVFEKLVHKRIIYYIDEHEILSTYQYGFRPRRSTQEAVFDLTKFIYTGFNNKKITIAACLDVCKAFDCINHEILLYKMRKIGFNENTISWFKSYLTRTQVVKFNNTLSEPLNVRSGIGQGTILGPLLFIFYFNDIICSTGNFKINMYADDCVLFNSGNNWNLMSPNAQLDLDKIFQWCNRNRLKLSESKSKVLLFGTIEKL